MRFLLYILVFVIGGVIGFFVGGAGTVASGVAGTQLGVCSAAKVAGQLGLISADQQNALLEQTSGYLRSEFPRMAKELGLADQPPLSVDRCGEVIKQIEAIRQRMQ